MRVAIDNLTAGTGLGETAGGMIVYLNDLLRAMLELAPQHEYLLLGSTRTNSLVQIEHPHLIKVELPRVPERTQLRIVYEQTVLPLIMARHKIDVLLATCNVTPLLSRVPSVVVIQDTQAFVHPNEVSWLRLKYRTAFIPLSLKVARSAIAVSEAEKRDLLRFVAIPSHKVTVVHHGISSAVTGNGRGPAETVDETRLRVTGSKPYIFAISTLYRFKNYYRLVEAFCRFKQRHQTPHKLVIAGRDDEVTGSDLLAVAEAHGLRDELICLGGVSHGEVGLLYRAAEFLVYVSQYETFGLPVLEAMSVGCPVVTSNVSSMPEIAGDAAIQVDPTDVEQIVTAMLELTTNSGLRADLSRRGVLRATQFTWIESARKTLGVLEEACANN